MKGVVQSRPTSLRTLAPWSRVRSWPRSSWSCFCRLTSSLRMPHRRGFRSAARWSPSRLLEGSTRRRWVVSGQAVPPVQASRRCRHHAANSSNAVTSMITDSPTADPPPPGGVVCLGLLQRTAVSHQPKDVRCCRRGVGTEERYPTVFLLDQHHPDDAARWPPRRQERLGRLGHDLAVQDHAFGLPALRVSGTLGQTDNVAAVERLAAAAARRWLDRQAAQRRVLAQPTDDHDAVRLGRPQHGTLGVAAVGDQPQRLALGPQPGGQPAEQCRGLFPFGAERPAPLRRQPRHILAADIDLGPHRQGDGAEAPRVPRPSRARGHPHPDRRRRAGPQAPASGCGAGRHLPPRGRNARSACRPARTPGARDARRAPPPRRATPAWPAAVPAVPSRQSRCRPAGTRCRCPPPGTNGRRCVAAPVVKSRPKKITGNRGRTRASRKHASRSNAVDKNVGIVHDVIARSPWGCRVATTSWQGGLALRYPNFAPPFLKVFPESAV